jgi:hypothetical protein
VKRSSKFRSHEELPIEKTRSTQDEAVFYVPHCAYMILLPRLAPHFSAQNSGISHHGAETHAGSVCRSQRDHAVSAHRYVGKCVSDIDDKSAFID